MKMIEMPEYRAYYHMIDRCYNENDKAFKYYGKRGIRVCDRWLESFQNFYTDMGDRPSEKHSLDRIDVNGNYEPSNCRWATKRQQARNTTKNKMIEYHGETRCLAEWSDLIGFDYDTVQMRLSKGWSVERAFFEPKNKIPHRVLYNEKVYSIKELADKFRLKKHVLQSRLKLGWSIERALHEPPEPNEKLITWNGKTQSLKKWSDELNLPYDGLKFRLNRYNYTVEEAFTKPFRKGV